MGMNGELGSSFTTAAGKDNRMLSGIRPDSN
jgi:hypothetical protein